MRKYLCEYLSIDKEKLLQWHLWTSLSTNVLPLMQSRPFSRQNQSIAQPVEVHLCNDKGTNEFPLSVYLESCLGASFMINAVCIVPCTQNSIMICDRLNDYYCRQYALLSSFKIKTFLTMHIHPLSLHFTVLWRKG